MPDQVTEKPKDVPGEKSLPEQLKDVKDKLRAAMPEEFTVITPEEKAKQYVVDNYNGARDSSKMPAITSEILTLTYFSGNRLYWKAFIESEIITGIMYEVRYNGKRDEAFIFVWRKINTSKVTGE